jgi:hypothetical protein
MFKKLRQFFNKKHTDEPHGKAQIEALANDIFVAAAGCAEMLIDGSAARKWEGDWEIAEDKRDQIILHYLNGLLVVADRVAFLHVPRARAEIMDKLIPLAHAHMIETVLKPDVTVPGKLDLVANALETYNVTAMLYADCKDMLPGDSVSPNDSVFWRFGTRLSKCVGYPDDLSLIMATGTLLFDSFRHIGGVDKIRLAAN